jgi:hypothetical protein
MPTQESAGDGPPSSSHRPAEPSRPSAARRSLSQRSPSENVVAPLLAFGGLVIVVGVIVGIVVALHAKVAPCEDGHYFPPGTTDFRCYAHPHAILGGFIVGASIFSAIVLALIGIVAHLLISARDEAYESSDHLAGSSDQFEPKSQI